MRIRAVAPLSIEDQGEVDELEAEMIRLEREERLVAREAVALALYLARRPLEEHLNARSF